ncbi:MAG: AMP-binding protein [Deltaproteobacteria bacterium]|nr:AMP-binding protein [Deltaproteobacteria bacterium]
MARLAGAFRGLGVVRAARVAVFLPQRLENVASHLAAFRIGAVSVPLSPLFGPEALRHRLGVAGARVIVTEPSLAGRVLAVRGDLPELAAVVVCDEPIGGEPRTGSHLDVPFDRLVREHAPVPIEATHRDDPAMIVFTSGTTGLPKGAVHAHRFVPGRLPAFELIHRLESGPPSERPFWTPADWAWVAGLVDSVLAPLAFGRPVLAWTRRGKLDPEDAVRVMRRANVGRLFVPPTALRLLAHLPDDAFEPPLDLESVHTAGEPLGAETYTWALARIGAVQELYGLTEVGAVIGCSPYTPVRPGSMGRPYPGYEVDLVDDRGSAVEPGAVGEIVVRADCPGMFLEYLDDAEGTAARFLWSEGVRWMRTGDLARRDADGYLWFCGRADDVFNTAGYRVGPAEIEDTLLGEPEVARAAVVAEPDEDRGDIVKAFVVLRPGIEPSEALAERLAAGVKSRLAAFEMPRAIVFARELPETVTGKLRRVALRQPDAEQRFAILTWRAKRGSP